MPQTYRDIKSVDFRVLQPIATVCEPSATISAVSPHLKQSATDCNMPGSEASPKTTPNPVVEHKGWDASFGFFVVFWFVGLWFGRDAFR
jgi:hypothetical protein